MGASVHELTLDTLEWHPYVEPVDLQQATLEQLDALKVTPSNRNVSSYVLVLAQDAEILAERTPLFNDIMYSRGGLSRAERELGALAASVVNSCIYCASVHANRYITLSKRPDVIDRIYRDGADADLSARDHAIFNYGVKLTREQGSVGAEDLAALREVGLSDLEILDLTHAVAIFGWANRLMHTLGEPRRQD